VSQFDDDDLAAEEPSAEAGMVVRLVTIAPEAAGGRLDKTLAEHLPDLSRGRIQALMAQGLISREGAMLSDASSKAKPGEYQLLIPPPAPADPQPENIPLSILYEDEHLIVVEKPPGMAVHPAPGSETGTLVNALLHHCGDSLSGIGGVARPGIVHRIDKETSGVMVAAKSDAAHQGLSKLFATHDIDRVYIALVRGAPSPERGTIETRLGRSAHRPQEDRGAEDRRPRGDHALSHRAHLRGRRQAAGGSDFLHAGDRTDPPDPGSHGLKRQPLPRRSGLWLRPSRRARPRGHRPGGP
jgi:23S rRNA pseudouridine1911/1915/1917 synthase